MTDKELYVRLLSDEPCSGCPAYEEVGGSSIWCNECYVPTSLEKLREELLPFLGWDEDIFLDYIIYTEDEEPNFIEECEEIDCFRDDVYWEDERFMYI